MFEMIDYDNYILFSVTFSRYLGIEDRMVDQGSKLRPKCNLVGVKVRDYISKLTH